MPEKGGVYLDGVDGLFCVFGEHSVVLYPYLLAQEAQMKSHDHTSTTDEGKAKARADIKASAQVTHPILQLQQLVENKAVANMIQRDPERHMRRYSWKVFATETGMDTTLATTTLYPRRGQAGGE